MFWWIENGFGWINSAGQTPILSLQHKKWVNKPVPGKHERGCPVKPKFFNNCLTRSSILWRPTKRPIMRESVLRPATRCKALLAWFAPYLWFDGNAIGFCKTGAIIVIVIIWSEFELISTIFLKRVWAIVAKFAKSLTEIGTKFRSCH